MTGSGSSGHEAAGKPVFDAVYRDHFAFVWRVLRGMGIAESAAEDAAQEVFVVVHRRLGEFEARSSIKTWLFEIALRVAANHRRGVQRKGGHEVLSPELPSPEPSPADRAESRRALSEVLELLAELDDSLRVVLVLSLLEQQSAPEIAEVLKLNVNTVSSRLRRGREELAAALERRRRQAR